MTPLGVALAGLANRLGDRPAVTCGSEQVTFAELEARTNRRARAYLDLGVTGDSLVAIRLPNGVEFVEATIAAWKAGATPQPISDRLPALEGQALVELGRPTLVVGGDPGTAGGRPVMPDGFSAADGTSAEPLPPMVARSLKALASGGSTGRPKLIVAGGAAILESLQPTAAMVRMPEDGVHLATGPLHHNGPFLFAMMALFRGNHAVVMPRFDAAGALALIEEHQVDWMYAVPTMMSRIWRLPEHLRLNADLSSLRAVLHLAAPCPPWLKQAWIDWLGPERILELYAGTEAQAATFLDGTEWLAHRGSVGRPVSGEMQILDDQGEPVAPGQVGSVWMRSGDADHPTYHYVGASATSRPGGWESLGDLGWMDADGYLYLTDRDSDMLLVGGSNVYPAEVEAALMAHPAVVDACVIGLPDDDLGTRPHALIHLASDVSDDELTTHSRERVAPYKCPRSFERVDHPLRDDAGKVRRSALRAERVGPSSRHGPHGG